MIIICNMLLASITSVSSQLVGLYAALFCYAFGSSLACYES